MGAPVFLALLHYTLAESQIPCCRLYEDLGEIRGPRALFKHEPQVALQCFIGRTTIENGGWHTTERLDPGPVWLRGTPSELPGALGRCMDV